VRGEKGQPPSPEVVGETGRNDPEGGNPKSDADMQMRATLASPVHDDGGQAAERRSQALAGRVRTSNILPRPGLLQLPLTAHRRPQHSIPLAPPLMGLSIIMCGRKAKKGAREAWKIGLARKGTGSWSRLVSSPRNGWADALY
jgi:hypothetical protein